MHKNKWFNDLHFSEIKKINITQVIIFGLVLTFLSKAPALIAHGLSNVGLIISLPAFTDVICFPKDFTCGSLPTSFDQEEKSNLTHKSLALDRSLLFFQRALQIYPQPSRLYIHLAETYFHLRQYDEVVATLNKGGWQPKSIGDEQWPEWSPETISPLLTVGHFEYYLILAYYNMRMSQWQQAVQSFRPALAYRDAPITSQDYQAFFQSAAQWHLQMGNEFLGERLASGRYFVFSGNYNSAIHLLEPLRVDNRLNLSDQAWAAFYAGQAYEKQGQTEAAIDSYQAGWQITPEVRQNGIALLRLFQEESLTEDIAALEEQLINIGPTYRPGRFAPGYEVPYQIRLASDLRFVGYDLEVESIADGVPLDFWIWWEIADSSNGVGVANPDSLAVGSYVLVHQQTPNLLLNGGFEWGTKEDGVPLGWRWRIYTQASNSSYVSEMMRDGKVTHVAVAANSSDSESSGMVGLTIPVQEDEWYLMGGWINDQGRASLGRECSGEAFQPGGPFSITRPNQGPIRPADVWVHVADLATAFPDQKPDQCSPILINYESTGNIAMWDDLFMVKVEMPSLDSH